MKRIYSFNYFSGHLRGYAQSKPDPPQNLKYLDLWLDYNVVELVWEDAPSDGTGSLHYFSLVLVYENAPSDDIIRLNA